MSKATKPRIANLELPIILEPNPALAVYQQVAAAIRQRIQSGQWPAGSRIPPSRVLAHDLKLGRNMIVAALEELLLEGYIRTQGRAGTFVVPNIKPNPTKNKAVSRSVSRWQLPAPNRTDPAPKFDFRLGATAIHELPLKAWKSAWRQVARSLPPADAGPVEGQLELRTAIAAYLTRTRGINAHPNSIFVTAGANAALRLVTRSVLQPGATLALENPGYPLVRTLARELGANTLAINVDDDGLKVETLQAHSPAPILVHVTPSHQYPLGGRLPIARRQALLEWAEEHDSLILENDYESEFRYDTPPLPALASLTDTGNVVYVGTFSRALTPALRIGYIVAPPAVIDECKRQSQEHGERVAAPVQSVLTSLLQNGILDRHIRRVRREYAERRDLLIKAFNTHLGSTHLGSTHLGSTHPGITLRGSESGLHVFLEVQTAREENRMWRHCQKHSILLEPLKPFFATTPSRFGALLGFAGTPIGTLETGLQLLLKW